MKRVADCASAAVGLRARQIAQARTAAEIARKVTQRVAHSEMVSLSGDVLSVLSMRPSSNLPIDSNINKGFSHSHRLQRLPQCSRPTVS